MAKKAPSVAEYLATLDPDQRVLVDALRHLIINTHPGLTESIKWNAPSFALGDQDLLTLGLEKQGAVRLVLHRGAKVLDDTGFSVADPARLARWPAPDRGVVIIKDGAGFDKVATDLAALIARWVAAVTA